MSATTCSGKLGRSLACGDLQHHRAEARDASVDVHDAPNQVHRMATTDKLALFRDLHTSGCFVVPNPWDCGTARFLASAGFAALATSSAALAFSRACPDSLTALDRDAVLAHTREIVDATELPVQADFQNGYGSTPDEVAQSVSLCVATGVAGLSIEDATGDGDAPLFDLPVAVERLKAARSAIDASGRSVVLTGRAECFLVNHPNPLRASITRLVAYAEAGADCLYAPGLRDPADIAAVVKAVAPKPVNVLAADPLGMSVTQLAELGVRRISIGSALARVAWQAFMSSATEIVERGTFTELATAAPFAKLNELFDSSPIAAPTK